MLPHSFFKVNKYLKWWQWDLWFKILSVCKFLYSLGEIFWLNQSFHERGGWGAVYSLIARVPGNLMIISSYPSLAKSCFLFFLEKYIYICSRKQKKQSWVLFSEQGGTNQHVFLIFFQEWMIYGSSHLQAALFLVNQLSDGRIKILMHSICRFPGHQYSYHGQFQGTNHLSTRSPNAYLFNSWLSDDISQLQLTTISKRLLLLFHYT